jgi:hypothetical protein
MSVQKFINEKDGDGWMTVGKGQEFGWKKFRFCPRVSNLPREQWTSHGRSNGSCIQVIGKIGFPTGTNVQRLYEGVGKVDRAFLIGGSLELTSTSINLWPKNKPLNDDNGIVSSLFDPKFEYPENKIVKSELYYRGSGLYFYSNYLDASNHPVENLNFAFKKVKSKGKKTLRKNGEGRGY